MSDMHTTPRHVAIIPDGNRRWARARGEQPWDGHAAGAKIIDQLLRYAQTTDITCMSFWGSSLQNLDKRPMRERAALLDLYTKHFSELCTSEDIHGNRVRVNIIGRWRERFPEALVNILDACEQETTAYTDFTVNFFLAYSGDDEMLGAVRMIVADGIAATNITEETIKDHLLTKDLPPIDLLIRTGDDPHLSTGFCMWETRNAQLYFAKEMFPDFDDKAFQKALDAYAQSARLDGK